MDNGGIGHEGRLSCSWHNTATDPATLASRRQLSHRPNCIPENYNGKIYSAAYHSDVLLPTEATVRSELDPDTSRCKAWSWLIIDYISESAAGRWTVSRRVRALARTGMQPPDLTLTRLLRRARQFTHRAGTKVKSALNNPAMPNSNVVYLQPRNPHDSSPRDARVIRAFSTALMRCPPRPMGIAACVAWLQESPAQLRGRPMAIRALQSLRDSLFVAPGREAEMELMWREAVATACHARVLAPEVGLNAPLLTGVGLLHRSGEVAALRALAQAERETGQRLVGPVLQEIFDAGDDELASRVTRSWGLPGELRLAIIRWREEQDSLNRPESVTLLMMAQALTTELVHAKTCTPGLAEAASEALKLPARLIAQARAAADGIAALLSELAPQPA